MFYSNWLQLFVKYCLVLVRQYIFLLKSVFPSFSLGKNLKNCDLKAWNVYKKPPPCVLGHPLIKCSYFFRGAKLSCLFGRFWLPWPSLMDSRSCVVMLSQTGLLKGPTIFFMAYNFMKFKKVLRALLFELRYFCIANFAESDNVFSAGYDPWLNSSYK